MEHALHSNASADMEAWSHSVKNASNTVLSALTNNCNIAVSINSLCVTSVIAGACSFQFVL